MLGIMLRLSRAGSLLADVLAIARSIDVDADREHREPIEDGHRDGRVAEVAAPVAERDVRGDRGRHLAVPAIDEVVEGVGRGRLVVALLHLAEPDVIDDQEVGSGPALESLRIRSVGERGVKVVEEIDAACVADGDLLLVGIEFKPTLRGLANEDKIIKELKLTKNTETHTVIDPKTSKPINVKHDAFDKTTNYEIKDTKKLSNTRQIRGEREVAKQQGKDFKIITGEQTKASKNIPKHEIIKRKDIGPQ